MTIKHLLAAVVLLLSLAVPVSAGPFEDADAAFKRGDYGNALRLLRPHADCQSASNWGSLDRARRRPYRTLPPYRWGKCADATLFRSDYAARLRLF